MPLFSQANPTIAGYCNCGNLKFSLLTQGIPCRIFYKTLITQLCHLHSLQMPAFVALGYNIIAYADKSLSVETFLMEIIILG